MVLQLRLYRSKPRTIWMPTFSHCPTFRRHSCMVWHNLYAPPLLIGNRILSQDTVVKIMSDYVHFCCHWVVLLRHIITLLEIIMLFVNVELHELLSFLFSTTPPKLSLSKFPASSREFPKLYPFLAAFYYDITYITEDHDLLNMCLFSSGNYHSKLWC
jgi:hypothetical protein